jgi:hypothetical protein
VNTSSEPLKTQINLSGSEKLTGKEKTIVPTSANPLDENTLNVPSKVSLKTESIKFSGAKIVHTFHVFIFIFLHQGHMELAIIIALWFKPDLMLVSCKFADRFTSENNV